MSDAVPTAPLARLPDVLQAVAPHLDEAANTAWVVALTHRMQSSGIVTGRRVAMFMGQVAEESGGFSVLTENLRYTTAARICAVWPSRFPTLASAEPYVNNPEGLANVVYAGRLGNGPVASGDGWRFRGEGLIDLTGRALISQFATAIGMTPDAAAAYMQTPAGAAAAACWYWTLARAQSLNALSDAWNVTGVTQIINGGLTNLQTRLTLCNAALKVLT